MSSNELTSILERLTALESNQELIKTGIGNLGMRMDTLEGDLEALDNKIDKGFEDVQTHLRTLMGIVSTNFAELGAKIDILAKDTLEVRAKQKLIEAWIEETRVKPS